MKLGQSFKETGGRAEDLDYPRDGREKVVRDGVMPGAFAREPVGLS